MVAPGELNWALCSTDTARYADCVDYAGNPTTVDRVRRHERVGAAHRRRGGAGDPGLPSRPTAAPRPSPAVGQADHHQHHRRHRRPGRPAGRRPRRRLQGGAAAESYKAPATPHRATRCSLERDAAERDRRSGHARRPSPTRSPTTAPAARRSRVSARALGAYRDDQDRQGDAQRHHQPADDRLDQVRRRTTSRSRSPCRRTRTGSTRRSRSRTHRRPTCTPGCGSRWWTRTASSRPYSVPQGDGNYGNGAGHQPGGRHLDRLRLSARQSAERRHRGPVQFAASVAKFDHLGHGVAVDAHPCAGRSRAR